MDKKFFYCEICKRLIVVAAKGGPMTCCGKPMKELGANTTDGAVEKHVPAVEREGNTLKVQVGVVAHPMLPEHFITTIVVLQGNKTYTADLAPGDAPVATFEIEDGPAAVYEFCNLHGLWKKDV